MPALSKTYLVKAEEVGIDHVVGYASQQRNKAFVLDSIDFMLLCQPAYAIFSHFLCIAQSREVALKFVYEALETPDLA